MGHAQRAVEQPAYVLHQRPYRETSLLLEVLTPDQGRVGLVARGARGERPRLPRGVLNPFVALLIGYRGGGELGLLTTVEATGAPRALAGKALLSGLYVNELLVRLLPRHDAHPAIYAAYDALLPQLAAELHLAWCLRRFERGLLTQLGYAPLLLHTAGHGTSIESDASYSYDPERGPVPLSQRREQPVVSGRALLALAGEQCPDESLLAELRSLMRALLRHALGGKDLQAWHSFGAR